MSEEKICPKCGASMFKPDQESILPAHRDTEKVSGGAVSPTQGFPLQVHCCRKCHFVELYAN